MTFPTVSGNTALAPKSVVKSKEPLAQSKETGQSEPSTVRDVNFAPRQKTPEVKPWAHLVAGGLVNLLLRLQSLKRSSLMMTGLEE